MSALSILNLGSRDLVLGIASNMVKAIASSSLAACQAGAQRISSLFSQSRSELPAQSESGAPPSPQRQEQETPLPNPQENGRRIEQVRMPITLEPQPVLAPAPQQAHPKESKNRCSKVLVSLKHGDKIERAIGRDIHKLILDHPLGKEEKKGLIDQIFQKCFSSHTSFLESKRQVIAEKLEKCEKALSRFRKPITAHSPIPVSQSEKENEVPVLADSYFLASPKPAEENGQAGGSTQLEPTSEASSSSHRGIQNSSRSIVYRDPREASNMVRTMFFEIFADNNVDPEDSELIPVLSQNLFPPNIESFSVQEISKIDSITKKEKKEKIYFTINLSEKMTTSFSQKGIEHKAGCAVWYARKLIKTAMSHASINAAQKITGCIDLLKNTITFDKGCLTGKIFGTQEQTVLSILYYPHSNQEKKEIKLRVQSAPLDDSSHISNTDWDRDEFLGTFDSLEWPPTKTTLTKEQEARKKAEVRAIAEIEESKEALEEEEEGAFMPDGSKVL